MKKGAVVFLGGGIWELVRFVAVFVTAALPLSFIENSHLSLLWVGAPALVLTAVFFSAAYFPARVPAHLPILRIGVAVSAISDGIVVVTGSYNWIPTGAAVSAVFGDRALFLLSVAVLVMDLSLASLLIALRPKSAARRDTPSRGEPPRGEDPTDESDLPEYDPTDLDRK